MTGPCGLGRDVFVVGAIRTPIGKVRGALSSVRPDDLAAIAVRGVLATCPALPPGTVDDVAFGAANQSGEDNRNVGRMAALLAGLPTSVSGTTLNRLCGSGLDALGYGFRSIALGETECVVVGGVESMSRAPFVLARPDQPLPREVHLVDTTLGWRFVNRAMPANWTVTLGETAELVADRLRIDRAAQDRYAFSSHQRAVQSAAQGGFADEIVPVVLEGGEKVERDESPRPDSSLERLAALPPVFRAGGTVTAGNSSPLNDGAAALLLVSERVVDMYGLQPFARVIGVAVAGVDPDVMGLGPVPATRRLLDRFGVSIADVAAIELNEAFAAQSIGVLRSLDIDEDDGRVNAKGGAIALGHPLGASGARIAVTLVHRLAESGGGLGLATMCIGVGQGISVLFEA